MRARSHGRPDTEPAALEQTLGRIAEVLDRAERVLLTSHRRPDGDGTGSMAGLASMLRARGKTAVIYSMDPIARRYKWLPLADSSVASIAPSERFDCTVIVDCADQTLLGNALPPPEVTGTVITIDHHASGRPFGDIALWDPSAAAVGVLVVRLAERLGWTITAEAAVPLYVSLVSDTGGFRHGNTNVDALTVAARLVAAGAAPAAVAAGLEERASPAKIRLLGSVLSTLELHCAGRVGVLTVDPQMVEETKANWEDVEGMVNWARNVEGVHVGVLLTAVADGGVRVSMRSRSEKIDVGKVCLGLGGGGHPGAGGCHLATDLGAARDKVVAALDRAFA